MPVKNIMTSTLLQMTVILLLGTVWRVLKPAGLTAEHTRLVLTQLVYYLLLPALVLVALWKAQMGQQTLFITVLCNLGILFSGGSLWLVLRGFRLENRQTGALILAVSIPNVTYLGLPVLEKTFGEFGRSIVMQFDLFGCEPLLFTVGILLAQHYGETHEKQDALWWSLCKIPPIWAAIIAVTCNLNHIPIPNWIEGVLATLAPSVAPLMLLSLGMGLQWQSLRWHNLPKVLPVLVIKLGLMPLFGLMLALRLGMSGDFLTASILEMAMPSMMFGIVLCDRYRLDSALYAMTVTLSTLLSLITIPLWYEYLVRF
jgi:predicted permease